MKYVAVILVFVSMCLHGQILPVLPSVTLNTNRIARVFTPPIHVTTNMLIQWSPYTNAYYSISNSPDLITWSWYTNVPVWQTSLIVPVDHPEMFYKVATQYMP